MNQVVAFLRTLDPKLVTTLVTAVIVRVALELGVAENDPLLQSFIALAAAAVAGWLMPNDGTVLRTRQESGNAEVPPELDATAG